MSTRGGAPEVSLSEAIVAGLAPDGGLYVPISIPRIDVSRLDPEAPLHEIAEQILQPFFEGDVLEAKLPGICRDAFAIPLVVRPLATRSDHVIELFHGPTAAFKDFGARFLAATFARLRKPNDRDTTILVATSGDTGAAVAAAFHRQGGFRVVILYPRGRVSPRQAHQLGCFDDNITTFALEGSFDDCQRLVKQALADRQLQKEVTLSSANSISLGRLLPQIVYYAAASIRIARSGSPLDLIIPTGNLGNALAAVFAREMKSPIGRIVLATNANDVLPRFFAGEEYAPAPSIPTIANAMDVGAPSNFERLRWLYRGDDERLREELVAFSVPDDVIRDTIARRHSAGGELFCPHTATAVHLLEKLRGEGERGEWAVVATAHPAKFDEVIAPLTGRHPDIPPALQLLLDRKTASHPLAADYELFRARLIAAENSRALSTEHNSGN